MNTCKYYFLPEDLHSIYVPNIFTEENVNDKEQLKQEKVKIKKDCISIRQMIEKDSKCKKINKIKHRVYFILISDKSEIICKIKKTYTKDVEYLEKYLSKECNFILIGKKEKNVLELEDKIVTIISMYMEENL